MISVPWTTFATPWTGSWGEFILDENGADEIGTMDWLMGYVNTF